MKKLLTKINQLLIYEEIIAKINQFLIHEEIINEN